jgi:hypothetical protein
VASVQLTVPSAALTGSGYHLYKPWLLHNFYSQICAYCITRHQALDVDHYEPRAYAPGRADDPTNLVLACRNCNGPAGKSDYHPLHTRRRRLRNDRSGHHVLDVRTDNLGALFDILQDGRIVPREGPAKGRAAWNAALLALDCPFFVSTRARLLEKVRICEMLLAARPSLTGRDIDVLSVLAADLADQWLFFAVFEVAVSDDTRQYLEALWRDRRNEGR